jgi:hypothetical protein
MMNKEAFLEVLYEIKQPLKDLVVSNYMLK